MKAVQAASTALTVVRFMCNKRVDGLHAFCHSMFYTVLSKWILDCIFPHCMYRFVDIFLTEMMSVQHGAAEQRHGKRHALESAPSSD